MAAPNILFIMADQLSAKALRCYGHPHASTPALDRLAAEGTVFDHAYCNSPLCGPSRLSMMSGLLPHKVGAYDNAPEFAASTPTLAHYLRLLGYLTCLSGKMHFAGPDQLHGYEERLTTDIYPSDFGWTPNWSDPDAKVRFQDMENVLGAGPCARSLQIDYDDEVEFQAVRWLYDQARSTETRPFMLTVSFTSPHDPYVAQPEFWDLYETGKIDLPKVGPLPADQLDAHSARILEHYSINGVSVTDQQLKTLRHGYYASISYIDAKVARLVATLEEAGLADNTIVIFASDHGDMMGERGLYYKKTFFEWSSRVPLIFWAPSKFKPQRIATPVSLLDLLPSFVELGGGGTGDILACDGRSLVPALTGQGLADELVAGEFLAEGIFDPTFMLRLGPHKLLYSEVDPPVLYDLALDPDERQDLASNPAHKEILDHLMRHAKALWHGQEIKERIIADQNRRRLIDKAHKIGTPPVWDYQPVRDASKEWVRAGRWTTVVEAAAHLPARR